jgi:hypothetical protein
MVFAVGDSSIELEREQRLNFGHVLSVDNVRTEPEALIPGQPGKLIVTMTDKGNFKLVDLRVELTLPAELALYNDVNKRNIANILPLQTRELTYNVIALPGTDEGIYKGDISIEYLNHIGDENTETNDIGIIVKGNPRIYALIDSSEINKKQGTGEINIEFVNNEIADIKFLTVELMESQDYRILSPAKQYIGDLDSDDFESIDYELNVDITKDKVVLPLKISYKDKLNNDYNEEVELWLYVLSAADAGVKSNNTSYIVVVIIIVIIVGYIVYRRITKKKRKE